MSLYSFMINTNTLRRLSFHWLLGLRYSDNLSMESLGLAGEIEILVNDLIIGGPAPEMHEGNLDKIDEKQDEIRNFNIFKRAYYWTFNICNYRLDFYLLAICNAYYEYRSLNTDGNEEPQGKSVLPLIKKFAYIINNK